MTLLVLGSTLAAARLMLPPAPAGSHPVPTPRFIAVNLASGLLAAIAGGWITSSFAPSTGRAAPHVMALAVGVVVLGVFSALAAPAPGRASEPRWYSWTLPLLGGTGVLLGGWLQSL
ncbi:MAG: hypothetical protein HOP28_17955 [Gemmatimonadales bacterium]|nr:hypothetical protein [Gemmatimonadales bacterium]